MIIFFNLLIGCILLINCINAEPVLHIWNKSNFIIFAWIQFTNILLRKKIIYIYEKYWYVGFMPHSSSFSFYIRVTLTV